MLRVSFLMPSLQDGHQLGIFMGSPHVPRWRLDVPLGGYFRRVHSDHSSKRIISVDLEPPLQLFGHTLLWSSYRTGTPRLTPELRDKTLTLLV